jgi:putative transposase
MPGTRKAYPSDLTEAEWKKLEPLIPAIAEDATHVVYERKEIVNAIFYVLRSGCPWRMMPHDLPIWGTVYDYFRQWRQDGIWDEVLKTLRQEVREREGRESEPSAAVIDSQSIKTSAVRGPDKGYDAGKKSGGANAPLWLTHWACYSPSLSWLPMWGIGREPGAYWSHARSRIFRVCSCCGQTRGTVGNLSPCGSENIWDAWWKS